MIIYEFLLYDNMHVLIGITVLDSGSFFLLFNTITFDLFGYDDYEDNDSAKNYQAHV